MDRKLTTQEIQELEIALKEAGCDKQNVVICERCGYRTTFSNNSMFYNNLIKVNGCIACQS